MFYLEGKVCEVSERTTSSSMKRAPRKAEVEELRKKKMSSFHTKFTTQECSKNKPYFKGLRKKWREEKERQ